MNETATQIETETALELGWVRWRHEFHRFPETDFNDLVLPIGARYFAELARVRLPQTNPPKV